LLSHLADRGWVCVAINYRLSPRNRWPAHIVDVKRAIAWVRRNIADFGGDPGFIGLTGGSAGGHLSSLAALTPNEPQWQPGFEDADTSVSAALPFYGAYDWVDAERIGNRGVLWHVERSVVQARMSDDPAPFTTASPMSRITADAPPMFVSHGTNDALIPVQQAREFVGRLRATSRAPVVYAELPRAEHGFDICGTPRAAAAAAAAGRFLGVVWGDYRRRRG
jgi:acetyl esterase/lipase